jgi:hypothetical protein
MDWNTICTYGAELALTTDQLATLSAIFEKTKNTLLPECLKKWHQGGIEPYVQEQLADSIEQYQFLLLLHIATVPFFKECYKDLPPAMAKEISADTGIWVKKMTADYGVPCLDTRIYGWCRDCFNTRVKQFGRLQCNSKDPYLCENFLYRNPDGTVDVVEGNIPDASKGTPALKYGDPVINIHIPEAGPMYRTDIVASLRAMADFSAKYQPDHEYKAIAAYSWLLDPAFRDLLPETSNIIAFQNLGHVFVMPSRPDETREVIWRLWSRKEMLAGPEKAMTFEQRTSLQRNVAKYLAEGGKFTEHAMIIFRDELEKL